MTVPDDQVARAAVRWSSRVANLLPSRQMVSVATVGAAVARTRAMSGPPLRAVTVTSSRRPAAAGTTVDGEGLTPGVDAAGLVAGATEGDGELPPAPRMSTRAATIAAARTPAAAAMTLRGRTALVTAVPPLLDAGSETPGVGAVSKRVISPVGLTPRRIGTPAMVAVSSISVPRSAAAATVRYSTA